ncbi:MAG: ribonuclease HII [Pseudomonadales bacterium]
MRHWRRTGLAGVDEAGRGPLAGPVCAAAVQLPQGFAPELGRDSKVLSATARANAAVVIEDQALAFGVGWASVEEIDAQNILQATYLAMRRALQSMNQRCSQVLVDGNRLPPLEDLCEGAHAVIKGDGLIAEIGAASILAKVARDEYMERMDQTYPGYGFAQHKGYGTRAHQQALLALGPCPLHRRSFAPVRAALAHQQAECAQ